MKRLLAAAALSMLLGMPAEGAARPRIAAIRTTGPIRLDGVLDEVDWERAPPITDFRLIEVREGEAPSESTDVRVLFSDTHVYFGIRCANRNRGPVRASLSPRDQILDDDHIAIHLDTYRDFHRAYIFGVNPHGVQLDGILDGGEPDFSWDAVWDAETRQGPTGWTAEIAIPLRTLRFPANGPGTWGLWIRRQITKNDEVCSWPLYRLGVAGDIMLQAGDLEGLAGVEGGGGYQAQPYLASTQVESRPNAIPWSDVWAKDTRNDAGLDLRYGITSTLTANLTANPDYSQVEADALQIDVNQRFPLYFPEKRPFFLEGAETFSTFFRLVYTRRMSDPAWGGKLIGKLGRWRVGGFAVRDDGGGSTEGIGAGTNGGPSTPGYFSIARATVDIGESGNLGVLVTDHSGDGGSFAEPQIVGVEAPSSTRNTVVSLDGKLKLAPSLFLNAQLARSATRLDTLVNGGPERRDHFADLLSTLTLTWNDGKRNVIAWQDYLGSRFRADAGFLERVDARSTGYEATVTFRPENRWLRYLEPTSHGEEIRDTRGQLEERRLEGALRWAFQRQSLVETRVVHLDERWLATVYDRWRYLLSVSNTLWRPFSYGADLALEDGIYYAATDSASYLGWLETEHLYATARPSPRLTSEITATHNRFSRSRGGERIYDVWLLGAKTTYQFTRRLYVRLYPQVDTYAEHLDADGLVGYVLHPGSVVYLGVTGDYDKVGPRRRATQRTVFLKVSYAIQG